MADETSQYEQERRIKRDKLRELGVDPYGGRTTGLTPLAGIRAMFKPEHGHDAGPNVKAAGRIVLKRDMGKLSFITVRDESGDLQVGLDKKRLSEADWQVRDLLDLGDQIVVEGPLGSTNKGEISIWASHLQIASKALLPPPAKWEGLSDVELRYRQRYVDLWANPEVMRLAKLRVRIVEEVRTFLRGRGFVEVETPMMQTLHGGANARPFITKMNALDLQLYMRIAPELYLKRLLVGGMPKIFELNRNFRNEGMSPKHNPEFTMLEAYEAYGSWETMAELVESMICTVAQNVFGTLVLNRGGTEGTEKAIDLRGDERKPSGQRWPRRSMAELVEERCGWKFDKQPIPVDLLERIRDANHGKDIKLASSPAEQLTEIYEKLVEPTLINPCFVTRVPGTIIPLARRCKDDDYFADVYELAINGQEISPGYTELNDPDIQAAQFQQQVGDKEEQQQFDEDFVNALKFGMPPAGGMGLGIDRLVMMLTGAESIRDVILFPLMRPVE